MDTMIRPRPLAEGDEIAIVSPASIIDPAYVEAAEAELRRQGWRVWVAPHALGRSGSYSGTPQERLDDISQALSRPGVRALLCSRGGYGCVELFDGFPIEEMCRDPRWLIGFSDVSALHALMQSQGIMSVHSPMCRHIGSLGASNPTIAALYGILRGRPQRYAVAIDGSNRPEPTTIAGRLAGGNMAVTTALIGTPADPFARPGSILFLEDVAEPIYKIERMLWQLRLGGAFSRAAAVVFGQFTDYRPSANYATMEQMLRSMTADLDIPVVYGFPTGHTDVNYPLLCGAEATLAIDGHTATISF